MTTAVREAIADFEDWMMGLGPVPDPLEAFCLSMRLYGRMSDTHPQTAQILVQTAPDLPGRPHGYNPSARKVVTLLVDVGLLTCSNIDLTLMSAFAAFESLIAERLADPSIGDASVDRLTALVLTWFGLTPKRAAALCARPLPAPPGMRYDENTPEVF